MPAVARVALGASTLNRKWYLDVDTSATAIPTWIGVFGIQEFTPGFDASLEEDSDFDSGGYKSQTKTAEQWTLEFKVARKVTAASATVYDPGQEWLRQKAMQMGPANSVHVRWYEMTPGGPRVESYEGLAAVSWSPDGGGMDGLDTVSVTLTGQGARLTPTHPDTP